MSRVFCQVYRQGQQICKGFGRQHLDGVRVAGASYVTSFGFQSRRQKHVSYLQTKNTWHQHKNEVSDSQLEWSAARCFQSRRGFTTSIRHASSPNSSHEPKSSSDVSSTNTQGRARTRSVIVTGGTSGIGYAVARQAIREGAAHVRIVTRDEQRGKAAIDRLQQETSTDVALDHIVAETSDYSDPKLFQASSTTTTSPFTTIVHCAGITQTSLLTSTRPEDISKLLSVNLESSALLTKSLLKRYMQTCMSLSRQKSTLQSPPQSWQIINISSLLAVKGGYGSSIYAASKAGLVALTRTVALEAAEITLRYCDVAPGFRANVVLPGYIETPMTHGISGQSREKLLQQIPAARFGSPEEVADAVMFLVGNEYANNCVLNLDGGLSAT